MEDPCNSISQLPSEFKFLHTYKLFAKNTETDHSLCMDQKTSRFWTLKSHKDFGIPQTSYVLIYGI